MDERPYSRFTRWLKRSHEDTLRLVLRYDGSEAEFLHLRADVEGEYSPEELEGITETHRNIAPAVETQSERVRGGSHRATVNYYDDFLIIQYPLEGSKGVVVSLDAEVGHDHVETVATGLQLLWADEADREIPEWIAARSN